MSQGNKRTKNACVRVQTSTTVVVIQIRFLYYRIYQIKWRTRMDWDTNWK